MSLAHTGATIAAATTPLVTGHRQIPASTAALRHGVPLAYFDEWAASPGLIGPVSAHMHSAFYLLPLVYSQINPNKVQTFRNL
jgi:hypothetical protein